jgi:hypothetical protein
MDLRGDLALERERGCLERLDIREGKEVRASSGGTKGRRA